MMTCRDVSTLIATGQLENQPIRRRLGAWMHLSMCQHCRRFRRQLRLLDRSVRAMVRGFEREGPPDLGRRVARRILRKG